MLRKPPPPKPAPSAPSALQKAADILGLPTDSLKWREYHDADGALVSVSVITGQGQKFKFSAAELDSIKATQADLKKRRIKVFKSLPHGPVRIPVEENEE